MMLCCTLSMLTYLHRTVRKYEWFHIVRITYKEYVSCGVLSFYEEGYTYKMDIIQTVKGRKIQYVKLNPIDTNSEIKHVLLGIDATTKHIYNLIEVGKNGTKTTLTVNSFKTDEPISKTLFTFDKSKYNDYFINKID